MARAYLFAHPNETRSDKAPRTTSKKRLIALVFDLDIHSKYQSSVTYFARLGHIDTRALKSCVEDFRSIFASDGEFAGFLLNKEADIGNLLPHQMGSLYHLLGALRGF